MTTPAAFADPFNKGELEEQALRGNDKQNLLFAQREQITNIGFSQADIVSAPE